MSTDNNITSTPSGTAPSQGRQVIENLEDMVNHDNVSVLSTSTPSRKTERLKRLFPDSSSRFSSFKPDSTLVEFLRHVINLDPTFIARLEQVGFVTPTVIINRFGLDTRSIALSFSLMGSSHIFNTDVSESIRNLVMFSRKNILNGPFSRDANDTTNWKTLKKSSRFNKVFEEFSEEDIEDIRDFLTDPEMIQEADLEMKRIQNTIKNWIKKDDCSLMPQTQQQTSKSTASQQTPTSTNPSPHKNPPSPANSSFESANSSFATIRKASEDLNTKMAKEVASILKGTFDNDFQQLAQSVAEVKASVSKEIDSAIARKMSNSIENRAKLEVQKHLQFLSPNAKNPTPDIEEKSDDESSDESSHKSPQQSKDVNDNDNDEDYEYLPELVNLPPTTYKSKRLNRRSSFYNRRSTFEYPKSPLDVDYKVGCNDDLFSASSSSSQSLDSNQKKASNVCKEWMRQVHQKKPIFAKITQNTTPMKRSPLPTSVVWTGKSGKDFEKFIDKFTGHVAQQPHMGYLLHDMTAILWIKHGDPEIVLRIGMAKKVHTSMFYISQAQFLTDVVWLYGALQQAITSRGRNIIRKFEHTQDGILAWKCLIDTHRYDGDVDIYLAEQQEILTRRFSAKYSGGMLQFLEDYENAFMNIEYVMQRQQMSGKHSGGALHTDDGKRRLFVQNFTVPDLTDNLIENVESTTDTWDAMVDELRRRLAKRNAHSVDVAKRRAHNMVSEQMEEENTDIALTNHINHTNFQTPDIQLNDSSINALINTLNTDWKVGYKLWKNLTQQLQKQVNDGRNAHLPPNSEGE